MPWDVRLIARGEKELARLPRAERESILRALRRLSSDFGALEIAKLAVGGNRWRLRLGCWRVIMELDNSSGTALVAL